MITPGHSTEERGDNQCKYNGSKSPAGEKGRLHRIPRRDGIKKSPAGGTFFLAQRKDPAHKYFRVDIHLLDYDFDLVFVLVCVVTIFVLIHLRRESLGLRNASEGNSWNDNFQCIVSGPPEKMNNFQCIVSGAPGNKMIIV